LAEVLDCKYPVLIGLANDEVGYIIPYSEWDTKQPHLDHKKEGYEHEELSLGPHTAEILHKAVIDLSSLPQ
jgi:hypothetical protein